MPTNPPLLSIPPRPGYDSLEVYTLAVDKILPRVLECLEQNPNDEAEVAEIRKQLMETRYETDGYRRCRYLDQRHSWDCDDELVEILADIETWEIRQTLVKAWVAANNIQPKLLVGDSIYFRNNPGKPMAICSMDLAQGLYHLGTAQSHYLTAFEDAEKWNQPQKEVTA